MMQMSVGTMGKWMEQGGGGEVVPDRLDLLPGLPLPLGDPSPSRGFGPRGPWETRTGPGFLLQAE